MRESARVLPVLVTTLLAAVFSLIVGGMAPEPDPVPRRWQLDVNMGPMRMAVVDDAQGNPRSYLYLTYKVTNNSGQDLLFAPSFVLSDGEGNLVPSGRNVSVDAAEPIQKSL